MRLERVLWLERCGLPRDRADLALATAAGIGGARSGADRRRPARARRAGRRPVLLRAPLGVRQRRAGPGGVLQRGDPDRAGRLGGHRRPAGADDSAGVPRAVLPAAAAGGGVRQPPFPRVLRRGPGRGNGRRAVPAPVPGLDRHRLRHARADRGPLRARTMGRARRAGRLLRRRVRARSSSRAGRRGAAGGARRAGLVRALLLRRDARAAAGLRRRAGLRPRAR